MASSNDAASHLTFYEDPSQPKLPAYGSMQPGPGAPPPYMDTATTVRASTDEMRRRQEDLERKAAELDSREAVLRGAATNVRENNFPPLPAKCCVHPCFYQDFDVDIPIGFKSLVKTMFYIWMVYCLLLVLNLCVSIAYLAVAPSGSSAATTFGLSILWVVLFPILSFVGWYRPCYKAFRSDSSLSFFIFFINYAAQIGVHVIQALGINACGTCGIINGLVLLGSAGVESKVIGGIMVVLGGIFGLLGLLGVIYFLRIHYIYRTTGASFSKAQQEFATRAVQNPHVQNAAISAAQNPHVQAAVLNTAQSAVTNATNVRF